ncbi:hypothetical protein SH528x_005899 [Novipirellula sp. SH528]|uniref:hypothetical protein n=1 Tax=Novipirellula sp. SH528 TaxID=3454466 RepID=UPI003F9F6E78
MYWFIDLWAVMSVLSCPPSFFCPPSFCQSVFLPDTFFCEHTHFSVLNFPVQTFSARSPLNLHWRDPDARISVMKLIDGLARLISPSTGVISLAKNGGQKYANAGVS